MIPSGMVRIDPSGRWLNRAAADALGRALSGGCPLEITSAGRTVDEQLSLIALHTADPVRYAYAAPIAGPQSSEHIAGNAIDTGNQAETGAMQRWLMAHPDFGFIRTAVPVERWHFAYRASSDAHLAPPAPPKPPTPTTTTNQEDDMLLIRAGLAGIYLREGGNILPIPTQAIVDQLLAQGVPVIDADLALIESWRTVSVDMVMLAAPRAGVVLVTSGSVSSIPTPGERDAFTARGVPTMQVSDELISRLLT